jgi:hypothetical protein
MAPAARRAAQPPRRLRAQGAALGGTVQGRVPIIFRIGGVVKRIKWRPSSDENHNFIETKEKFA